MAGAALLMSRLVLFDIDPQDAALLVELCAADGPRCERCGQRSVLVDVHLRQRDLIAPRLAAFFCCTCLRAVTPEALPDIRALLRDALSRPVAYTPTGNFLIDPSRQVNEHRIAAKADFFFEATKSLIAVNCDAWIDPRSDVILATPQLEQQVRHRLKAALECAEPAVCTAMLSASYGVREHPEVIKVEPTQFCNMRCSFCSNPNLSARSHLRFERFASIWSTLDPRRVLKVGFTGLGESLLNKEFWDMQALVKHSGIYTTLVTNGALLGRCANRILESGLNAIAVSLESLNAQTYERDRLGGCLSEVLRGIENFASDDKQRSMLHVICAVKSGAHRDAISVIEFCHRQGLPMPKVYPVYERFSRHVPAAGTAGDASMDEVKAALVRTYGHAVPLCREDQLQSLATAGAAYEDMVCSEPKRIFVIRANGSFAMCNEAIFDLDDLAEHRMIGSSVEQAWRSEHFRRRRLSLYLRRPASACAGCNAFTIPDRFTDA